MILICWTENQRYEKGDIRLRFIFEWEHCLLHKLPCLSPVMLSFSYLREGRRRWKEHMMQMPGHSRMATVIHWSSLGGSRASVGHNRQKRCDVGEQAAWQMRLFPSARTRRCEANRTLREQPRKFHTALHPPASVWLSQLRASVHGPTSGRSFSFFFFFFGKFHAEVEGTFPSDYSNISSQKQSRQIILQSKTY